MSDYSQLEMSRNMFQPSRSKFLSGDLYEEQISPMEQELMNSKYLNYSTSASKNVDLSRSLIKYIDNERQRESRNNILGKEVRNIVSYLQENEIDSEKLHNISGMLMDDSSQYISAEERQKMYEESLRNKQKTKGILKKRNGLPSDALDPIDEEDEDVGSKKKSSKSKSGKEKDIKDKKSSKKDAKPVKEKKVSSSSAKKDKEKRVSSKSVKKEKKPEKEKKSAKPVKESKKEVKVVDKKKEKVDKSRSKSKVKKK